VIATSWDMNKIIYMKEGTKILEEKSNLFVFDRTEVVLILIFVVVIAATSFAIGVRVGKKLLLASKNYMEQDVSSIELKSTKEEYADTLKKNELTMTDEELRKEMLENANDELAKAEKEPVLEQLKDKKEEAGEGDLIDKAANEEAVAAEGLQVEESNPYMGKYTIQLGSYQNLEDAKNFAEGFIIKEINPIINKVEIPEKGYWYRVSIGAFESRNDAVEYINSMPTIFQGKEYRIYQIKE
jgi:cell division protein FtsN